ncbi:hypothetical protein EMCRGX_G013449 [Ephydatia muelleri]
MPSSGHKLRNTAPGGPEYVPQLPSNRPSGDTEDAGEDTTGERNPRCGQALQGMCHTPEVQTTDPSEVTTRKHPDWTTVADDAAANLYGETGKLEKHLPLALYTHRTATHSTTGVSPFQLMYGRHSQPNILTPSRGYGATSYQAVLQAKMAELQDLVGAHIAKSAQAERRL